MGKAENIISIVIFNAFFLFFIFAVFLFIQQYKLKKKEHLSKLNKQVEEHQKEILSTQVEIQSQTMQNIGREIHDNVGQKLTLINFHLQQLAIEKDHQTIVDGIKDINEIVNQSLSDLRGISKSLTDDFINKSEFVDLLKAECTRIQKLKICKTDFQSNVKKINLDYQTKSILYRISQEFLQNSIKHSGADKMTANLFFEKNNFLLELSDNGKGFDTKTISNNGIGLSNMKKRAELIGASFLLNSSNKGTVLTIKMQI